jgi:hypothetical protein
MELHDLTNELRDFLTGFASSGPDRLAALPRGRWAEAVAAERMRRLSSLVSGFSAPLLAALESGAVDGDAVVDELSGAAPTRAMALSWSEAPAAVRDALTLIAHRELRVRTLDVRGSDALDFHDVGVVGLRCALVAAFDLGGRNEF